MQLAHFHRHSLAPLARSFSVCAVLIAAILGGGHSIAEQVRIPVGEQNDAVSTKPAKGSSKAQVEAQFGSPESRRGPVGDPPIHYWDYKDFTVYFEGDYVIHSVSKFKSNTAVHSQ